MKLTLISVYYRYKTHSKFIMMKPGAKLSENDMFKLLGINAAKGTTYTPGG